jgi:hypothetical protein
MTRDKKNIELTSRQQTTAIFRSVFDSVLAQIGLLRPIEVNVRVIRNDQPFDIDAFLRSSLKAQAEAVRAYSYFVPEENKEEYQKAWENYRKAVETGGVLIVSTFGLEHPLDYIENKIHAILRFAKDT